MRSSEETKTRSGLVVPLLTILDEQGTLIESDQRALVRFVTQDGQGADVVYVAGTTGEREQLTPDLWRRLVRVCVEEAKRTSDSPSWTGGGPVESWVGITARSSSQTLHNLLFAVECGADAVVLAPFALGDLRDPVRFVSDEVRGVMETKARGVALYIDDCDRETPDRVSPRLRVRQLRALLQLDFVRGVAARGGRHWLGTRGSYAVAAASSLEREHFGIFARNPMQIFEAFRPRQGFGNAIAARWSRRQLGGRLPSGVMADSANTFPREWAGAWQGCRAGDSERMNSYRDLLESFHVRTFEAGGRRTIACYKRALQQLGVISSSAVASGTPALLSPDIERFDRAFRDVQFLAQERIGESRTSARSELR